MKRPYVFCHMLISIDGKIMGNYMDTPQGIKAGDIFYDIAFGKKPYYHHQGWLSGRVTTDDNFTFYKKPQLDENAPQVPEGDYIADDQAKMYYVSIDPKGRLGWEESTLVYEDTKARVIEILTDKASNAYKALLRKRHISYMIVGEDAIDFEVMLEKLKENFHIETLMLGGGGVLNWSFIQQGLCDEVSLVVASAADGSDQTPTLFEMREKYSDDTPVEFALKEAKVIDENALWLRYKVKEVKRHE